MLTKDKIIDASVLCDEILANDLPPDIDAEVTTIQNAVFELYERVEDEPFSVAEEEINPLRDQLIELIPTYLLDPVYAQIKAPRLCLEVQNAFEYSGYCSNALIDLPFDNPAIDLVHEELAAIRQMLSFHLKLFEKHGDIENKAEVFQVLEQLDRGFQFDRLLFP